MYPLRLLPILLASMALHMRLQYMRMTLQTLASTSKDSMIYTYDSVSLALLLCQHCMVKVHAVLVFLYH